MQVRAVHEVGRLGTILVVGAHPDDETFIAAGVMAAAVQNGQKVVSVTFTHGEAGIYDAVKWPPERLGNVREQELHAALRELGVQQHYLFDYPDGRCAEVDATAALRQLCDIFATHCPDTVITFGKEGLTGHPDHQAVCAWVDACVADMPRRPRILHAVVNPEAYKVGLQPIDEKIDIFFNIDQPPLVQEKQCALVFVLSPELLDRKCRALAAMPSQTERLFAAASPAQLRHAFEVECFVEASVSGKGRSVK